MLPPRPERGAPLGVPSRVPASERPPAPRASATWRGGEEGTSASWQDADSRSRAGLDDERSPAWDRDSRASLGYGLAGSSISSGQSQSSGDVEGDDVGDAGDSDGSCESVAGQSGSQSAGQSTGQSAGQSAGRNTGKRRGIYFSNRLPPRPRRPVAVVPPVTPAVAQGSETRDSRSRDHRTRGSSLTEGLHSVVGGGGLSPCQAVEDFRKAVREIELQHGWDETSGSP